MVRWCWVNFQCRGVLLIWLIVGQGPTALAVGTGGDCLDIFSLVYHFSFLSSSLWETARYRLKYCLKGPLSPKQPFNQPTNHLCTCSGIYSKFCKNCSQLGLHFITSGILNHNSGYLQGTFAFGSHLSAKPNQKMQQTTLFLIFLSF